jgi:predicted TPR repeat methyltransferase
MASSIIFSSGDVVVDRRFEWARESLAAGDFQAAADLLEQTIELAPAYAPAWFALGEARERFGQRDGAIAAYRKAIESDPEDRHGATLHLIRLGALPAGAMPAGYLRALYDSYAPRFEKSLVGALGYRAPELLLQAVRAACPGAPLRFPAVLDLGCGTGLAGVAIRPHCSRLIGVDLSPAMLAKAREKDIYDRLIEADVLAFLAEEASFGSRYQLILAADVFIYFDALGPLLKAVALVSAPSTVIAFSVETYDGNGVMLRDTLRYGHSAAHVRASLDAAGLELVSLDSASTRTEKGLPVPSLIVVARSPAS